MAAQSDEKKKGVRGWTWARHANKAAVIGRVLESVAAWMRTGASWAHPGVAAPDKRSTRPRAERGKISGVGGVLTPRPSRQRCPWRLVSANVGPRQLVGQPKGVVDKQRLHHDGW